MSDLTDMELARHPDDPVTDADEARMLAELEVPPGKGVWMRLRKTLRRLAARSARLQRIEETLRDEVLVSRSVDVSSSACGCMWCQYDRKVSLLDYRQAILRAARAPRKRKEGK